MAYSYSSVATNFAEKTANQNNSYKLNKTLLKHLLSIQAPSRQEAPVVKFVLDFLSKKFNNGEITYEIDKSGNLLITKGKADLYPCLVAHMDEVNSIQPKRVILELNNVLIGLNPDTGKAAGCPGD